MLFLFCAYIGTHVTSKVGHVVAFFRHRKKKPGANKIGDFLDAWWQQTYQVNPLFSAMCARPELREQLKFTSGKSAAT